MSVSILFKKKDSSVSLPEYKTVGSAGADIRARIDTSITLPPFERRVVGTGLFPEIPSGFELQVRPRSGLSFNHGITVLNTPGTIDSDYRGEIKVCLINLSKEEYVIHDGDRIAQIVISPVERAVFSSSDNISETERGSGGFGSTGV